MLIELQPPSALHMARVSDTNHGKGLMHGSVNLSPTGASVPTEVVYRPVADDVPVNSVVAVVPAGHRPPRRVTAAIDALRASNRQQDTTRREDRA